MRSPSSVDQKRRAGYQRRGRRGEKDNGAGNIHRFADAAQFDHRQNVSAEGIVGKILLRSRRADERRRDVVDGDVVLSPFDGETTC